MYREPVRVANIKRGLGLAAEALSRQQRRGIAKVVSNKPVKTKEQ